MKTIIQTPKAPAPIGPYNQAILVDNTLYASGQIALDPKTMEVVNRDIEDGNHSSDEKPIGSPQSSRDGL